MSQLADWTCHKTVRAGKLLRPPILRQDDQARSTGLYDVSVEDINGAPCVIECDASVFARSWPEVGDYVVIYADGYKSWSPAKAFEEGYTRNENGTQSPASSES